MSQPAPLAKKKTPRKRTLAEKAQEASTQEQTADLHVQQENETQEPPTKKKRTAKRKQPTVYEYFC